MSVLGKKEGAKILLGLRTVGAQIARYRSSVISLSILGVLAALANGIIPYLMGKFLDTITSDQVWGWGPVILPTTFGLLGIWLVVQLSARITEYYLKNGQRDLGLKLYSSILSENLSQLLDLPLSFHKKHKVGKITNRINRVANQIEFIINRVVVNVFSELIVVIIALIIVTKTSWQLTVVVSLGLAVYLFAIVKSAIKTSSLVEKAEKIEGRLYGDSYDAIFNIQEIKQTVMEKEEQKKIRNRFEVQSYGRWIKITQMWNRLDLAEKLIVLTTQSVVLVLSLLMVRSGSMTVGQLVAFNAYTGMLFGPFLIVVDYWQLIQNGFAAIVETDKIMKTPAEKYVPSNVLNPQDLLGKIEFKNVTFGYERNQPALKNISFTVNPGETIALVGESGVGKTTLINLLSGYYFPRSGKIIIDGNDLRRLDLRWLRRQIGIVSQEIVLFNDTIKKNISYGSPNANQEEIEVAAREAHVYEFVNKFKNKWNQIVGERGVKLSVGQKQRVAIARAILRQPKILILDEPTSALDAQSEMIITQALEKLMVNKTTFIIAHRLSTVRRADIILVLKEGRIVETGRHEELIKIPDGVYRKLYELQIGLHA